MQDKKIHKTDAYLAVEAELLKELNDYVSSCIKSANLNDKTPAYIQK